MKQLLLSLIFLASSCAWASAQCYYSGNQISKCCGAETIDQCPLEGCGGDPLLNQRKNLTVIPDPAIIEDWKFNDMLYVLFTDTWTSGADRSMLTEWGEGKVIRLSAHLKKVKNYPSGKESTNCNLKKTENNDFHLVLTRVKNKPEEESITAEITPRLRPGGWTLSKLKDLAARQAYVRVTGYLMFDSQHAGEAEPKRYTHWEIHPVTDFDVCTLTKIKCNTGDGWKKLEEVPEP